MGRINVSPGEERVKSVFRVMDGGWWNLKARAAETGGADRDQQGGRRLPACGQIVEAAGVEPASPQNAIRLRLMSASRVVGPFLELLQGV